MTSPTTDEQAKRVTSPQTGAQAEEPEVSTGRMHQNVPVWSDPTCACEAEPYWQAVADEMEREKRGQKPSEPQDTEPC